MLNRFRIFMQGRYGTDKLNFFLAIILICLAIASRFVDNIAIIIIQIIILALFLFRFLSRDIYKRRGENDKFLRLYSPVENFFKGKTRQYKDKNNKYFKCPKCSAKLRVPKNRGKITVTCPVCRTKFDKNT